MELMRPNSTPANVVTMNATSHTTKSRKCVCRY
jgi:hypothetical protein